MLATIGVRVQAPVTDHQSAGHLCDLVQAAVQTALAHLEVDGAHVKTALTVDNRPPVTERDF